MGDHQGAAVAQAAADGLLNHNVLRAAGTAGSRLSRLSRHAPYSTRHSRRRHPHRLTRLGSVISCTSYSRGLTPRSGPAWHAGRERNMREESALPAHPGGSAVCHQPPCPSLTAQPRLVAAPAVARARQEGAGRVEACAVWGGQEEGVKRSSRRHHQPRRPCACRHATCGRCMAACAQPARAASSHGPMCSPTEVHSGSGMGPRSRLPSIRRLDSLGSAVLSPHAGGSSPVSWLKLRHRGGEARGAVGVPGGAQQRTRPS